MNDAAALLRAAGLARTGLVTRALRTVMKRRFFVCITVLTLGVGMVAATVTLSITDAVLMQPLPVHDEQRLAVLWGRDQSVQSRQIPLPYGSGVAARR